MIKITNKKILKTETQKIKNNYTENFILRAAVQAIPSVGGSIDTLLAGGYQKTQFDRINASLEMINYKLENIEMSSAFESGEDFDDFMLSFFEKIARVNNQEKIDAFTSIFVNQVSNTRTWDDAQSALRLLANLEITHLKILKAAFILSNDLNMTNDKKIFFLTKESYSDFTDLSDCITEDERQYLPLVCSELVAKGLLRDEGVNRLGASSMMLFSLSDLAKWFIDWTTQNHKKFTNK